MTNDDEVCIPSLSSILLAVMVFLLCKSLLPRPQKGGEAGDKKYLKLGLRNMWMSPNSEEMAEKLSTGDKFDANPPDEKVKVLNKIAEVSYQQGNYHLATKKWTQSGNRLQAMKSLLKSGDTEKIIFFANVSRQRDIYILAGKYIFLVKP